MRSIKYIILLIFLAACSGEDDPFDDSDQEQKLADLVAQNEVEIDNVIACASGSENINEIIAYLYPRPGATDIRYFETQSVEVDKNDYTLYTQIDLPLEDIFNGFLKKFVRQTDQEKWVIISFRESGKLHLSNPIRLKHQTQNTILGDAITINQTVSGEPLFNWSPVVSNNDAIYFQVISDMENELISGTYTFESQFQFYNLDNVVLNITQGTPDPLVIDDPYAFTLMAVSEDNWVNYLALQIPFIVQ